jgi:hypothetical protein
MMAMSLHLFVQLYKPAQQDHFDRMLECLASNTRLPFVAAVTVMADGVTLDGADDRLRVVPISGPMTYASLLEQAASSCCPEATHFAIANTDIFLTADLEAVLFRLRDASHVVALTRHESNGSLYAMPLWSQDLWLFKAHAPSPALLKSCDYRLGVGGCESVFAMSLYSHGYQLWNPCLDCRIIHNDPSPRHDFPSRYYGAYLFMPECRILDVGAGQPAYQMSIKRSPFSPGVSLSAASSEF